MQFRFETGAKFTAKYLRQLIMDTFHHRVIWAFLAAIGVGDPIGRRFDLLLRFFGPRPEGDDALAEEEPHHRR